MDRRKLLKFLGAAPIAGPAAAKEAASKMGLASVLDAPSAAHLRGGLGVSTDGLLGAKVGNEERAILRIKRQLLKASKKEAADGHRKNWKRSPMILDADLAVLKSMSPSAARAIQVERYVERAKSNTVERLEGLLKRLLDRQAGREVDDDDDDFY